MTELFSSGRIVDIVLAVLAAEILWVAVRRGRGSRLPTLPSMAIAALPGIFLLLALRAALTGAGWIWVAVWLATSFPAHLADLWHRARAESARP
jgi:hypothetical protein